MGGWVSWIGGIEAVWTSDWTYMSELSMGELVGGWWDGSGLNELQ